MDLSPDQPPAEAWQQARLISGNDTCTSSGACKERPWPLKVLRSSQADAARLDDELIVLLHEQFMRLFSYFKPGDVAALEPELNGVLMLLIFAFTVWRGKATPGSQLLNLRYRNEYAMQQQPPQACGSTGVEGPALGLTQRVMFGLGYVLLPWVWSRVSRAAQQWEWEDRISGRSSHQQSGLSSLRIWHVLQGLERMYKVASLSNLVAFLHHGTHRSLLERLVGARLVYQQPHMTRVISFEYLNRQLVWQELSEVLLFVLPLLDVTKMRRALASLLTRLPNPTLLLSSGSRSAETVQSREADAPGNDLGNQQQHAEGAFQEEDNAGVAQLPAGPCPLCTSSEMLLPFVAVPCGHVYCYYCLRTNSQADIEFRCPVDGARVKAMRRWRPRTQE
mmetsp:Transcript_15016/g.32525  ORF Transcript_15016/g.32525 Transcript_15016/m.32525 type:complete len:392 (-) Transcript_15016:542-1717(-)